VSVNSFVRSKKSSPTLSRYDLHTPAVVLVLRCFADNSILKLAGQVKFHPASGSRSTLVLRDKAEDTSYWVEGRQSKSEIHFFKNYATNGYLGYDPNGDYIYTKAQHYGAEEWILKADEQSSDGRRGVVLFANFGKKYLAIRDGKLTGVSKYSEDCIWILD